MFYLMSCTISIKTWFNYSFHVLFDVVRQFKIVLLNVKNKNTEGVIKFSSDKLKEHDSHKIERAWIDSSRACIQQWMRIFRSLHLLFPIQQRSHSDAHHPCSPLCVRKSAYSLSSTHPHPHPGLLVGRECDGGAVGPDMKTTPFLYPHSSSAEVGLREDSGTQSIWSSLLGRKLTVY
jgi:hypothetical protein